MTVFPLPRPRSRDGGVRRQTEVAPVQAPVPALLPQQRDGVWEPACFRASLYRPLVRRPGGA